MILRACPERFAVTATLILTLLLSVSGPSRADTIDDGIAALGASQLPDGSWGGELSSPATVFQSTSEALETLSFDRPQPTYGDGLGWIAAESVESVDHQARALFALATSGGAGSARILDLAAAQNADGGFGIEAGFASDLLDTSLALRALVRAGHADLTALGNALAYLIGNSNADGGVGLLPGESSTVYDTALYLLALREYQLLVADPVTLGNAITDACSWLTGQQNGDGGWGAAGSTVFESGLVAYAMARASCVFDAAGASAYMEAQFLANLWNDNAYETALATRALLVIERPNLSFGSDGIRFDPLLPVQSENVLITAAVQNLGLVATPNVTVRFFDGDPAGGGVQIGSDQIIPNLDAGAASDVSVTASFADLGARDIFVVIDPDDQRAETSELDNTDSAVLNIVVPAPDLTLAAGDIAFTPPAPDQGATFSIAATVTNQGRVDASGVVVRFYDGDPGAGGSQIGIDQNIGSIAVGASAIAAVDHSVLPEGPRPIFVVIDPDGAIAESLEDNNQASAAVIVQPVPDLAIAGTSITFTPPDAVQGQSVDVEATVTNEGGANAGAFNVIAYAGDPDAGGVQIASWRVGGLPTNSLGARLTVTLTDPPTGDTDIYVDVDTDGEVAEITEANNRASAVLTVIGLPDPATQDSLLSTDPAFPAPGETFTARVLVRNLGDGEATDVVVRFYDGDPAGAGVQIGTDQTIASIPGGASAPASVSYSRPAESTFRLYAVLDPDDAIADLDEGNNVASRNVLVVTDSAFEPTEIYIAGTDDAGNAYSAESNGDGTFADLVQLADTGDRSRGSVIADFDHDGDLDLIAGTSPGANLDLWFYERRDGLLLAPAALPRVGDSGFSAASYSMDMAAGDFNGDGDVDFIANGNGAPTWLFINQGKLDFGEATFYQGTFETGNDGWGGQTCNTSFARDASTANSGTTSMRVFASNANGSCLTLDVNPSNWFLSSGSRIEVAYRIPPGTPVGLLFLARNRSNQDLGWVFVGGTPTADPGTVATNAVVDLIDDDQWHTVSIDLDRALRDVFPDTRRIAEFQWWTDGNAGAGEQFWFDDVRITRRTVESGFEVRRIAGLGGAGRGMDAVDLDADGDLDLVRGQTTGGYIYVLENDGDANFTPSASFVADPGNDPYGVIAGDFDGDGIPDLIGNNNGSGDPYFFKGNGDRTFQAGQYIPSLDANNYSSLGAYDLDDDGNLDVIASDYTSRNVWFYPGTGAPVFGTRTLIGRTASNVLGVSVPAGRVPGQPYARASATPNPANAGAPVSFDGSGSYDEGSIVDYAWDFGDGSTGNGATVDHTYAVEDNYVAVLTVTDDEGKTDRIAVRLAVRGTPPVADAGGPYVVGEAAAVEGVWAAVVDGSGSSDAETSIALYEWDFDDSDGVGVDATGAVASFNYGAPGLYTVTLTVEDEVGNRTTSTTTVQVTEGAVPVAVVSGPGVLGEAEASLSRWFAEFDLAGSGDDVGIAQFDVDFGDGNSTVLRGLRDNFDDGDLGNGPIWTANNRGSWTVVDGEATQTATNTSSQWSFLQDLTRSYRDFELEVDFKGLSTGNGLMGIVFRNANSSGSTDSYLLYSQDSWNFWRLYDWKTGRALVDGGSGWDPNIRYHLRLRVEGDTMQLFVTPEGGVESLQVEAPVARHPEGGVGLLAYNQSVAYDNIKVTPLNVAHVYDTPGSYTVEVTATDHAGQSSAMVSEALEVQVGAPPVVETGGPYLLGEAEAFNGRWDLVLDASASGDDTNIQRVEVDFGDGTSYSTGVTTGVLGSYFVTGTDLYGFDVPQASVPRVIATEDDTDIEVLNLDTGLVIATRTNLDRLRGWAFTPPEGSYFKIIATKPVVAWASDAGSHSAFMPSMDRNPVGNEFIFDLRSNQGFFVYAYETGEVSVYDSNDNLVMRRAMPASSYWEPAGLSNGGIYRVESTGKIAMQTVGNNGFTTVPSSSGEAVGREFLFATVAWTTGAFAVFAREDATVDVVDMDTGEALFTRVMTEGELYFQAGAGTRRLRLDSTGDVELWAGDTQNGSAIENLGDDISMTAGSGGTSFLLHDLTDGVVIFAPNEGTVVTVDGGDIVETLRRDQYLHLRPGDFPSGPGLHTIETSLPVVIQTLGAANAFDDMGTWLGGVSLRHRYAATGIYTVTVTVVDNVGQSASTTTEVEVVQGTPPVADIDGPAVADEGFASGGGWSVTFDASGSTDDTEIIRYEWDFGDGGTGTGVSPTHVYTVTGDYTVTLTVTDRAGQIDTATFLISVILNDPPVADAGGPYTFGEEVAEFGVWKPVLDASGSSDDFAIFDYEWFFDPVVLETFDGAGLDTGRWLASTDGVTQADGVAEVLGAGSWGNRYLFSVADVEREEGRVFRARVVPVNTSGNQSAMFGFKNANASNFSYTDMPYALYMVNGAFQVYENGAYRGQFGSYTRGQVIDIRVLLRPSGVGAVYQFKRDNSSTWTTLYTSGTASSTTLKHGVVVNSGTFEIDDLFVLAQSSSGPQAQPTYAVPGTYDVALLVRDNALQQDLDQTTVTIEAGDPPVADAGGPYVVEVGSEFFVNGSGSTDDVGIERYDWVFGNTTGGPPGADLPYRGTGAITRHFYDQVGTYTVELTVTDQTGQTGTDTAEVEVVVGATPIASIATPADSAVNGPPAYFDASQSVDDHGIVEYRWDFDATVDSDGDGDPTNDIDGVGPRPFHTYAAATSAAGPVIVDDFEDGTLDGWIVASNGTGSTTEANGLLTIVGNSGWGRNTAFTEDSAPRRRLRYTTTVRQTSTGASYMMVGVKNDNAARGHYDQLLHALYFNNGSLLVYENGSNRGTVGSYSRDTWYEVRIDVMAAGAAYFIREQGASAWTSLTSFTSLNSASSPLRLGMDAYSGSWDFQGVSLEGLGPYVVTLTVEDGAGQTSTATIDHDVVANLPPDVITVPWVPRDLLVPHETYDGKAIRLKGIVRDADPATYQWDFGDGTSSAVMNVTNPYDLSVTHTYPNAPVGTPFVATLRVWDSEGQEGSDTYNVVVRAKTLNTEVNVAIDEGLWYLHQTQTRGNAEGYPIGYWTIDRRASATASAIQAFEINGHLETTRHDENPYAETVMRGLRQLFRDLGTVAINTQTYGEPDTNGNGIGIQTGVNGSGGDPIYQGGQVMDAIASSGARLTRTITGASGIKRRRYFDVLQDMADQFAWGQTEQGSGGAWRYSWNNSIDNSAAQWGAIGLLAAQDVFGIPVPPWVKERNEVWLARSYHPAGGGFGYTVNSTTRAGTPSAMVQMRMNDDTTADPRWVTSEAWIANNWTNQFIISPGNRPYYPYFALAKAMRLALPKPVVTFSSNGFDWFNDETLGLARTLVDDQLASGQFPGNEWISQHLRSAWGVIILSQTLFVQTPVAVAGRDRAWAVDRPIEFDGSESFHNDPFRSIVLYEWDFDGDGVFDSRSTEPTAVHTYDSADYPGVVDPDNPTPVTVTVTLRVTDNNSPALTDLDSVNIVVAEPPHPPIADAGPPGTPAGTRYVCTAGIACALDGSDSVDIDPFDEIVRYEWELDNQFPFDFDEASGVMPTVVFDTVGIFDIGLRVWDNGQFNDLDDDGEVDEDERLSDQEFVKVEVVPNLPPVADANGPYAVDEGDSIALDASGSSDPNGDPLFYAWDLDADGAFDDATGVSPSFTGVDDGDYPVAVRVSDSLLDHDSASVVTVNNVAPTVDPGPDQNVGEGETVNFAGAFTDPGVLDTHTISWDFGDGTPGQAGTLTPAHVYADDGVYTVTLTVTDDDGGIGTGTLEVTVANRTPGVEAGPDQTADEGEVVSLAPATFTDPGTLDTHTSTVDWGDGTPVESASVTQAPFGPPGDPAGQAGSVDATHVYADDGVYVVTVIVADDDGGASSDTLTIVVGNVAPLVDAGEARDGNEGEVISLASAGFSDAGTLDTHTASIDWGDGSAPSAGSVTESPFGPPGSTTGAAGTLDDSHVYADDGVYVVTVTVFDDDGGSSSDTTTVTVGNVAPVVEAGPDQTASEGQALQLTGATFSDAGTLDTHTASVDWGDGSPVAAASVTEAPFGPPGSTAGMSGTLDASHSYSDDGIYTVTVTVIDDEGGTGSDTFQVTVSTGSIAVEAGPDQSVNEGDPVQFDGSFVNSGAFNSHSIEWAFGDGEGATGSLAPQHVYPEDGVFNVTLVVTDDDGDSGADGMTVTVNNVAPIVDAGPDQTADEGDTVSFSGSFTDPGVQDTHTVSWDFGDGSAPVTGSLDTTHLFPEDGVYIVTLTVTDDDGGIGTDTATVVIGNVEPAVDAGPDRIVDEGDLVSFAGAFTDPGVQDTHTVSWDFGDGTPPVTGTLTPTHVYPNQGVFTVTLVVTDDDGGIGSDTLTVTVNNVLPVVDAGPDQTVDEGDTVSFTGSFTDPGVLDPFTISWDFGDGTPPVTGTLTPTHVYPGDGVYTVTLTVFDDVGSGSDTLTVTVEDGDPPVQTIDDLAGRAKPGKVDLTWTPVPGAEGYNVYRSTTPGGPYTVIAGNHQCSYCAYADFGLTNGQTYYYVVTSIAGGVESAASNEASATPTASRTRSRR